MRGESRLVVRAVSVVTVIGPPEFLELLGVTAPPLAQSVPHHRALEALRESPGRGVRGQLTLSGKVAFVRAPDSPSTTAERQRIGSRRTFRAEVAASAPDSREHQADATQEEVAALSRAARSVHTRRLGPVGLGRNEPTAAEGPDAEPSTTPTAAGSTSARARTHATWSKRRLATSLAFATLFFGGAAFSAGAGDVVADAIEGETTTEVTSPRRLR